MTAAGLLRIVEEILAANRYGFLVTTAGQTRVRLVHHLTADVAGGLWIGTSPASRKAADVATAPEVTYAVEDRGRFAYVTLSCTARVVDDGATLTERWVPRLGTFFPAGPLGGDFVLLALTPHRIELMSFADRVHPDPYGLAPAVLVQRPGQWETVEVSD